ncbi:MAG: hypothetical protein HQP61_02400 [Peptococcaceae bacterium]|nr:hypothetical protein [Candidatus Syntrophopropionicum ammoniitolerans]
MSGKVIYLRREDKPVRSVLIPRPQPQCRWRWNWRKGLVVTAGLVLVWIVAVLAFCEATGGW